MPHPLIQNLTPSTINDFFRNKIRQYKPEYEDLSYLISGDSFESFSDLRKLGECTYENTDELLVFTCRYKGELSTRSSKKKQYDLAKKVLKEDFKDGAIFIFYDNTGKFRFSFIRRFYGTDKKYSTWKRYTYFVQPDKHNKTFKNRILSGDLSSLDHIQAAFAVEQLSKEFYKELSTWYFASLDEVEFPNELGGNQHTVNSQAMIRLITRMMFVWFMKQKRLIPREIFENAFLDEVLNYNDRTGSTYYKAILQNLFFATLNTEMGDKRKWITSSAYGVQHFYRYPRFFIDKERFLNLMKEVPFLNGGLFESLDDVETADKERNLPKKDIRIDCFSNNTKNENRLKVPDYLFFGKRRADISIFLDDDSKTNVEVHGLIDILRRYDFTIDENTPDDQEVALDPELLGTVFENLLASYNPETQNTARKESGSFYTPRPIVDYMVQESLVEHLEDGTTVDKAVLRDLVRQNNAQQLDQEQKKALVDRISNVRILDPACGSGAFPMGCLQHMVRILQVLDPENALYKSAQKKKLKEELTRTIDESNYEELKANIEEVFNNQLNDPDYARKLFLIQNCLYGVDIQSIAMQISKLRFFISLLVDQEIDRSEDNLGVKPLPNLETKFVAANTLIQLDIESGMIKDQQIQDLEEELAQVRESYFNARTHTTKKKYRALDEALREQIADSLIDDGWANETACKIARWDPFDQNASSDWFDAEWMFGVNKFDVVIGNPPYIQLQKALPGVGGLKYADLYKDENYKTFERTGDIYSLFYEKGTELLRTGGVLCYITSNKWMRAKYGKSLRKYFAGKRPLQIIDLGPGIFDAATVDTNILLIQNLKTNKHHLQALTLQDKEQIHQLISDDFTPMNSLDEQSWIILSPQEKAIKSKIERIGTPLKEWDVNINYGIKTGYNKAFIIDGKLRDQLIAEDPASSEIIKPLLRGRNIKRYKARFADLWLIASHNGYTKSDGTIEPRIQIEQYPAIKRWLDSHWDRVKRRYDQGDTPYNLRNCAYMQEFEKEKVIYQEMVQKSCFLFDLADNYYCNDTGRIITGSNLKFLLPIFNSKFFFFCIKRYYGGGGLGESGVRMKHTFFEKCPIPSVSLSDRKRLESIVDTINTKKVSGENTTSDEQQIDLMVYQLYELTYDEVLIVDPETPNSREVYETFSFDER